MPSPLIIKIQEQEKVIALNPSLAHEAIIAVLTELDRELSKMKLCSEDGDGEWDYYIGHDQALTLVRAKLSEAIKELGE